MPPIKAEPIDADAQKELDRILSKLVSEKADIREAARKDLGSVDAKMVGAIGARIEAMRESLDRDRAPRVLEAARKAARDAKKSSKDDDAAEDDWLEFMLAKPQPKEQAWRDVVELLGMVRMLTNIGTTPAVRQIIQLRASFGEMLRLDISRAVAKLKDKAVPALLEAKKHDAVVVQRFAELELDRLGRAIPGEAVGTTDPDVLADVLRAFGYLRDVDAVGVCLSFANHERKKVRLAARQAITGIGEPARWQLRDTYQDLTGDKPDKSVPWDVLAKRIFFLYDRSRVAELSDLAVAGMTAARAGKHADAVVAFDKVLARDPLFDERAKMAPSYFEVGKTIGFDKVDDRLAMLRKAKRLDPAGPDAKKIDAEIAFTEAKALLAEGRPDRSLVQLALELDPDHAGARELAATFEQEIVKQQPTWPKRAALGGIAAGTAALLALVASLALFRKKRPPTAPPPPTPEGQASGGN
ncbi:MAG: hypothetical protein JNL21_28875 [Myxococcales bacterium]|nr:hypothetical protein [Myxococcales bacterium]